MKITKKNLHLCFGGLKEVFNRPLYIVLALVIAVMILVFSIWLPNLSLIKNTIVSSDLLLSEKAAILWASLGAIKTNFSFMSRLFTMLISLLAGLNIAMLVYYLKRRIGLERTTGTSVVGMFFGLVGVGCASCGSVILSSFLGIGVTGGIIGFLPLRGSEFALFGIALLLWSNYSLALKIKQPAICLVEK